MSILRHEVEQILLQITQNIRRFQKFRESFETDTSQFTPMRNLPPGFSENLIAQTVPHVARRLNCIAR